MSGKVSKAFGQALRESREKRAMSLLDLSVSGEIDRSYIWELEKGKKNASLEMVFRLARALHINAADLIKLTSKYLE